MQHFLIQNLKKGCVDHYWCWWLVWVYFWIFPLQSWKHGEDQSSCPYTFRRPCTYIHTYKFRPVLLRGAEVAIPPSDFGRWVSLSSTRGADYAHHIKHWHPHIFKPFYGPEIPNAITLVRQECVLIFVFGKFAYLKLKAWCQFSALDTLFTFISMTGSEHKGHLISKCIFWKQSE